MPALSIPYSFNANQTAASASVNANFNAVATFFNTTKIDSNNIQTGGIIGSNLAANTVTGDKLASDVADGSTIQYSSSTLSIPDAGVTLAKLTAAVQAALCPAGSILAYGGTSAPTGWALCNGDQVARSGGGYDAVYAAIGVAFGSGNGTTTFHLPDFRGRFLRGLTTDTARDPDYAARTAMNSGGGTAGNVGSVQSDEYKIHSHVITAENNNLTGASHLIGAFSNSAGLVITSNSTDNSPPTGGSTETRPKNAFVNFIIKK